MNNIGITLRNNNFSAWFFLVTGLVVLFGLSGCGGGGGGDDGTPDQDASGLFNNGTAELNNGAIMINDLRAFVHGGRIIAFSIAEHILFDGQITSISGNDFNATVNLYESGEMTQADISVTGSVTSQSSISGTLGGTGVGSGTFSLTFDLLYDRGATGERIRAPFGNEWGGPVSIFGNGTSTSNFSTANDETDYDFSSINSSPLVTCFHDGTVTIPNSTVNIYALTEVISNGLDCDASLFGADYSGFAAVVDGVGTDDTLLYAVTNATRSVFAVLTR